MSKRCPVCGKGIFREKRLKKHIRRFHPDYLPPSGGISYLEKIRRAKEMSKNE